MIEIADVFRRFADGYLAAHGGNVLPSHKRAITDIMAYRTGALGGHVWRCGHCSAEVYSYHSCKNRSCPKCHTDQTERWLAARQAEVLPCRYFHITVTVPEELRETLRANQKACYPLLMNAAGEAIIELPAIPAMWAARPACWRFSIPGRSSSSTIPTSIAWWRGAALPAAIGLPRATAISWSRRLHWPGSFAASSRPCSPSTAELVAEGDAGLIKAHKPVVGDGGAEHVTGQIPQHGFRPFAPRRCMHHPALGPDRFGQITSGASNRWRITRLKADEFMRRFLQHVLPKGLHKVRYFGLWHPAKRGEAARVRLLLQLEQRSAAAADATHP